MNEERPSRLYRMIEARLDGTLAEYVEKSRPSTSWRDMAADLTSRTGIEVSYEALRSWFADRLVVEARIVDRPNSPASAA